MSGMLGAVMNHGKIDPDAEPTQAELAAQAKRDKALRQAAMLERGRLNKIHDDRKKKRRQKRASQRRNRR